MYPETGSLRGRAPRDRDRESARHPTPPPTNSAAGPNPLALEQLRHLANRQPFAERDRKQVDVAASDLGDDLLDRHRPIEPVLARLQPAAGPAPRQLESEPERVANHPRIDEPPADRAGPAPGGDFDELLAFGVALVGLRLRRSQCRQRSPRRQAATRMISHRKIRFTARRFPDAAGIARALRVEIVLQDDRGRRGVELRFAFPPILFATRQQAFGFAAAEPLVLQDDRHTHALLQRSARSASTAAVCSFGFAVQAARITERDGRKAVRLRRERGDFCRERRDVRCAAAARRNRLPRPCQKSCRIRQRKPDAARARSRSRERARPKAYTNTVAIIAAHMRKRSLVAALVAVAAVVAVVALAHPSLFHSRRPPRVRYTQRLVILGFDGMDPALVGRWMHEGKLPNMKRLAEQGGMYPLATTHSPESPTAWASFATGVNPGKHNIYDFLVRDTRDVSAGSRHGAARAGAFPFRLHSVLRSRNSFRSAAARRSG